MKLSLTLILMMVSPLLLANQNRSIASCTVPSLELAGRLETVNTRIILARIELFIALSDVNRQNATPVKKHLQKNQAALIAEDLSKPELESVRRFLYSADCSKPEECSEEHPRFAQWKDAIQTRYQHMADEINDASSIPSATPYYGIAMSSEVEVPRSRAMFDLSLTKLSYYKMLQAILIQNIESCKKVGQPFLESLHSDAADAH